MSSKTSKSTSKSPKNKTSKITRAPSRSTQTFESIRKHQQRLFEKEKQREKIQQQKEQIKQQKEYLQHQIDQRKKKLERRELAIKRSYQNDKEYDNEYDEEDDDDDWESQKRKVSESKQSLKSGGKRKSKNISKKKIDKTH